MFRAGREPRTTEHIGPFGVTVRLHSETMWFGVETRWGGGRVLYHRPIRVESGESRVAVHDHVAMVKLLVLAVALSTPLIRRLLP